MQVLDAPRGDAVDEQAARRPLWMHAAGLLVVLVALLPLVGTSAVFSADEGAALIQARRVVEDGTWVGSHPLPDADQEVLGYPVHLAEQTADGWHELTRHPLYIHLVATTWSIGGFPAAMLLSMLATAGAALASGALAGHLDRRLAVPTLWAVGLASPLLFDGYLVIAHSAGALGAALAALLLVGRWHRAHLALGAIACAGVVLLRSEGLLLGLALSAALLATGARQRHRGRLLAGWTVGVATVGAYLFDGWWTSHLKGPTIGTAGPGIGRFQGGLRGRWEGFERTWLWVGRGGLADGDELILLAVIVAGAAAVALRRGTSGRVVTTLGATSVALVGLRLLTEPHAVVPGLLFAFPLLLVGLLLLRRPHLALGDGRARDLALVAGLYALAVVATQYSVGGTTEWGGRYFALGLPFITPLLVAAVLDAADRLERADARRWVGSLVVLSLALSMLGVLGLRRTHQRTDELVDTVAAGIEVAGPDAVVVTDVNPLARWAWPLTDEVPWTLVGTDDLDVAAVELDRLGVERFVYVGHLADEQQAVLEQRRDVVAELTPGFDERWRVVVFE